MNPPRSNDERRFETEQLEAARQDDGGPSPNLFVAPLELAGIVAIVALTFLFWSIAETLIRVVRDAVDGASLLSNTAHSVRWLGDAAVGPSAKALNAIAGVTIFAVACRSLSRARSANSAFARRGRT